METIEIADTAYGMSISSLQAELDKYLKKGLFGQPPLSVITNSSKLEYPISSVSVENLTVSPFDENKMRILVDLSVKYNKEPAIYIRSQFHIISEGERIISIEKTFSRIPTIRREQAGHTIEDTIWLFEYSLVRRTPKHRKYEERDPMQPEDTERSASPYTELLSQILFSQSEINPTIVLGAPATGKSTLENIYNEYFLTSIDPESQTATWTESFRLNTEHVEPKNNLEIITGQRQPFQRKLAIHILGAIRSSVIRENTGSSSVTEKRINTELENIIIFKSLSLLTNTSPFFNGSLLQYLTAILSYRECSPFDSIQDPVQILEKLENIDKAGIKMLKKMESESGLDLLIDRILNLYSSPNVIFTDMDEDAHLKIIDELPQCEIERRSVALHYLPWIKIWQKVLRILLIKRNVKVKTYDFTKDNLADLISLDEHNKILKLNLPLWNILFSQIPKMLYILASRPENDLEFIISELSNSGELDGFVEIILREVNNVLHNSNIDLNLERFNQDISIKENIENALSKLYEVEAVIERFQDPASQSYSFTFSVNNQSNQYSEIRVLRFLLEKLKHLN